MTREQFIAEYRHRMMGVISEGVERGRDAVAIGLFLKWAYPKIEAILGVAFDEANPPKPVVTQGTNGVHKKDGVK